MNFRQSRRLAFAIELAFLGHALKRLARILDPVLIVVAIGRQKFDDLIGSAGARTRDAEPYRR